MRYAITVIIVILVLLGIWWLMTGAEENGLDTGLDNVSQSLPGTEDQLPGGETTPDVPDGMTGTTTSNSEGITVTYSTSGFLPRTVTIEPGTTVTFVNENGGNMWVASDEHPTHTEYAGTSLSQHCPDPDNSAFDQCVAGAQYSFTFTREGTWEYHNHRAPQHEGTVIVQ